MKTRRVAAAARYLEQRPYEDVIKALRRHDNRAPVDQVINCSHTLWSLSAARDYDTFAPPASPTDL